MLLRRISLHMWVVNAPLCSEGRRDDEQGAYYADCGPLAWKLGDLSYPGGNTASCLASREAGSGASGRFASGHTKRQTSYRLLWPEREGSCVLLCAQVRRAKNGG